VARVTSDGHSAQVDVDTDPSHPYVITCIKGMYGLWYERGGHNEPAAMRRSAVPRLQ